MKKHTVVMANKLILSRNKSKFTVQESRILCWCIGEIYKQDRINGQFENKELFISIQEYAETIGAREDNTERDIVEVCKNLINKSFEIQLQERWKVHNWFSSIGYDEKTKIISFMLTNEVIPYILGLKDRFTVMDLRNIIPLNSSYAIKIYQIMCCHKKYGITIILEELKKMLGIEDKGAYKLYGAIKRDILEISKKEINEKTDILIDYQEIKEKKRVASVKFIAKEKNKIRNIIDEKTIKKRMEAIAHKKTQTHNSEDFLKKAKIVLSK